MINTKVKLLNVPVVNIAVAHNVSYDKLLYLSLLKINDVTFYMRDLKQSDPNIDES